MATRTPSGQSGPPAEGERLQKVLARAGFGSRRTAEGLIADGRVTVDGDVARLGQRIDPERSHVEVDGVPVSVRDDVVYYLLNKPRRVVTTARDPEGRPTAVDLVPSEPRVFPVGRLDYDTEGLLLLTNDGELAQLVTHPRIGPRSDRATTRRQRRSRDRRPGRPEPDRAADVRSRGPSGSPPRPDPRRPDRRPPSRAGNMASAAPA